jgi:hypothetical protein
MMFELSAWIAGEAGIGVLNAESAEYQRPFSDGASGDTAGARASAIAWLVWIPNRRGTIPRKPDP